MSGIALRRPPRPSPARSPRAGISRHILIGVGLAAPLGLAAALVPAFPAAANAPDTTVTVDVSQTGAAPTHVGSGFLYGLSQDGSGPADSWLQPLAPTLFRGGGAGLPGEGWIGDGYTAGAGYRARIESAIDQAKRVTAAPYNARYDLLVSDLYGAGSSQPANTIEPCDNGDCSNWIVFIDQVVSDVKTAGVIIVYDIWNEPDGTSFWQRGVNSAQYLAGTLDDTVAGTGNLAAPTGQWWAYRAYGSLTGALISSTSGNSAIAVAAADQSTGQANVLIGNNSGQTGTTTVRVQGLGSTPWLTAGSTVHATLMRIPDQTPLSQPITMSDSDVTIDNGSISLPVAFQAGTDAFWLVLSPHGVAPPTQPGGSGGTQIVVDGNEIGTADDQFQYDANWGVTGGLSDMYEGTADWSHTAGATATFRFTGSQVALHAVHDFDQGIMTVSLDGEAPQTIDNYAPVRDAAGVVWTSPALADGTHTLTIVNIGNRNSASAGINIALDRADVTP
ncbi:MAG TPA: hypothetical protein VGZ32_05475 [Actinocrinis sp.]|jgi:hypothetical protein|uniref:hypothetical protein n=1 Tax=Actinocrinis sp. TaxID=1920516 RepID=UPI002DDCC7E8|nr:hypothetical protein [Actinocrinis sp.]HEV3169764.1 hypothetical protein [Actinocrinis sp.]